MGAGASGPVGTGGVLTRDADGGLAAVRWNETVAADYLHGFVQRVRRFLVLKLKRAKGFLTQDLILYIILTRLIY